MLDGDQVSNWLNTISQGQNTTRRFARHTCKKRGIADTIQLQFFLQSDPVESLLMNNQLIYSLFPSILWCNAKGILSVLHFTAGSVTLCQINRSLDPVIGHCFHVFVNHLKRVRLPVLQSPFSKEVGKVVDTNPQAPIPVCAVLTCFQWVVLIVQKRIKSHYSQAHWLLKILWFTDTSPIDSAESTKTNQSILIVELLQRNCRKLNLDTEVGLPYRGNIRYKTPLLISIVYVMNVNASSTNTLSNQSVSDTSCTHFRSFTTTAVFLIQLRKLIAIFKECLLQIREVLWTKEVHIFPFHHFTPQVAVDVKPMVTMTNSGFLCSPVVLQHQQLLNILVPDIMKECCATLS